ATQRNRSVKFGQFCDKLCTMSPAFEAVFATLKSVFGKYAGRLRVKVNTPIEYTLIPKQPPPLPQHKRRPTYFGCVHRGKVYVSFHLKPLYTNPTLAKTIS